MTKEERTNVDQELDNDLNQEPSAQEPEESPPVASDLFPDDGPVVDSDDQEPDTDGDGNDPDEDPEPDPDPDEETDPDEDPDKDEEDQPDPDEGNQEDPSEPSGDSDDSPEPKSDTQDLQGDTDDLSDPEDLGDLTRIYKPEYIPGTDEYIDRLTDMTLEKVKAKLGDDFDEEFPTPKQQAYFNTVYNQLDRAATEALEKDKQALVQERKQKLRVQSFQKAQAQADARIEKVLSTPELQQRFLDAIENLKKKEYDALIKAAAEKNDFTGFEKLANSVAGVQTNIEKVNRRKADRQARDKKNDEKDAPKLGSDLLGF